MVMNSPSFRAQYSDEGGGIEPTPPRAVTNGRLPDAGNLEGLKAVPGQPRLKELSNEAILDTLARFKQREEALQREVVSEAGGSSPVGARTLEAWRADWKEFLELRKSVERLYLAEAIRRGIHEDGRGYTTLLAEVSELVTAAIKEPHPPVLRLMSVHTTDLARDFLQSQEPEARKLALQEWKFPLGSVDMLRRFLSAVVLEEVNEGEGVNYLKERGRLSGKRIPAPITPHGASQEPRTFWGKVRDFLLEDRS